MRKLLLVFALIAIVASVDLNQEFSALLDDIKLNGVDWNTILNYAKRIGCAAGSPVCCAAFPAFCNVCKAVFSSIC